MNTTKTNSDTNTIFNTTKTLEEYSEKKLFGVGEMPLLNTIHKNYPKLWKTYKEMKALDWDENEIDYSQCLIDFEKAPKEMSDMMIKTLMWQWEADSIAAQAPTYIITPFEPCLELFEAEKIISVNEGLHGLSYSEVVRTSFKDPDKVLSDILQQKEIFERSTSFGKLMKEIKKFSVTLAYNKEMGYPIASEEEQTKYMILYYFIMLCLERIQFMCSFAITFTICQTGFFMPIGSVVMKICQDELEIHSEYRKEVLKILKSTPLGEKVFDELRPVLTRIIEEVVEEEHRWTKEFIFENNTKTLIGTNQDLVCSFGLFAAKDVANTFKLKPNLIFPKNNPMPHLEQWMDLSKIQQAPQEQDIVAYQKNTITRTNEKEVFNF